MPLKQPGVPIALAGLVLAAFLAPLLIDAPAIANMAAAGRAPAAPPAPPEPPEPPDDIVYARHDPDDDDHDHESETRSKRGWLGVHLDGSGVIEVVEGGAADKAGLQDDDRILEMDGQEIDSSSDIIRIMRGTQPGDSMRIKVMRGDEQKTFNVKLAEQPDYMVTPRAPRPPRPPRMYWHHDSDDDNDDDDTPPPHGFSYGFGFPGPRLGIQIHPMSDELRSYFKAPKGVGLLVDRVMEDTPAAKAGLRAGDVVVKVDGKSIEGIGDIASALSEHEAGDKVTIEVIRDGSRESLDVTLEDSPGLMKQRRGDVLVFPKVRPGRGTVVALPDVDVDVDVGELSEEIQREVHESIRKSMQDLRREMQRIREQIRIELQEDGRLRRQMDTAIKEQTEASIREQQKAIMDQQRALRDSQRRSARSRQVSWEL